MELLGRFRFQPQVRENSKMVHIDRTTSKGEVPQPDSTELVPAIHSAVCEILGNCDRSQTSALYSC